MAVPIIYHAESFNPGWEGFGLMNPSIIAEYSAGPPGESDSVTGQFGRGTNQRSYAVQGNPNHESTVALGSLCATTNAVGVSFGYCQNGNFGTSALCTIYDSQVPPAHELILGVDATGHVFGLAISSAGFLDFGTSTQQLRPGTGGGFYDQIEVVVRLGTPLVQVKVGGVDWLNASGFDTTGLSFPAFVQIGGFSYVDIDANTVNLSSEGRQWTDWIIHDGSDFLGEGRVIYSPPVATGTYTAATPFGAATLVDCVADSRAADDTAYIEISPSALPKAATFTTLPLPSNVNAVKGLINYGTAERSVSASVTAKQLLISGATEDETSDITILSTWAINQNIYMNDPNTSAPWTKANADAVEVGFRRTT